MKEFVKDYVELTKESGRFMKKHWKGYLVLCAVSFGVSYGIGYVRYKKALKEWNKNDMDSVMEQYEQEDEA